MKSHRASAVAFSLSNRLRCTTVAAAFTLVTIGAFAQAATPASRATELLTRDGRIAVTNAGPYVEVGTFQIQVAVKLGAPTARLADGTWLYDNFNVEQSNARGTLVVRFEQGRVHELSLVTPAVATAMMTPRIRAEKNLVAHRQ